LEFGIWKLEMERLGETAKYFAKNKVVELFHLFLFNIPRYTLKGEADWPIKS
jgi:hypothetical protein